MSEFGIFGKNSSFELDYEPNYKVVTTNEGIREAAEVLSKASVLAVDTENSGLLYLEDNPILLQVANTEICYIFHGWLGLDFSPMRAVIENEDVVLILQNAFYDYKFIDHHYGIELNNIYDTMVAERLLTVGLPGVKRYHSFADLSDKYLGMIVNKAIRDNFIGRDPVAVPITIDEYRYSANDVFCLFEFYNQQLIKARELELLGVFELEFQVIPATVCMEMAGVAINKERWRDLLVKAQEWLNVKAKEVHAHFKPVAVQDNLFGLPTFNLDSHLQLQANLKRLGFILESTEEKTLTKYKNKHPVFDSILAYRGFNKILSTYGEKLLSKVNTRTNRLHAKFNQIHADTGRYSSSGPNLQNIPGYNKNDPTSLDFRGCFVPEPGYKFVRGDYSQQELRILAALSGDPEFRKAYTELDKDGKFMDAHTYTASLLMDIPYSIVDEAQRKIAKSLNFLLVFGGGAMTLSERLGCSIKRAEGYIIAYFKRYPKIEKFLNRLGKDALRNLYSTTISGRKRFYSLPPRDDPMFTKAVSSIERQGKNTPMQGGGADVTKKGLYYTHKNLKAADLDAKIVMVIHDEIVVEVKEEQAEQCKQLLEESMIAGWDFYFQDIPMVVDAKISDHWAK